MSVDELKERYDRSIEILSDGVEKLEMLAENKQLKEQVEDLTELVNDQEERITDLEAILIFHHIDPESNINCKSQGE